MIVQHFDSCPRCFCAGKDAFNASRAARFSAVHNVDSCHSGAALRVNRRQRAYDIEGDRVRRVLRILLLSSLGLAGMGFAEARERLVMPFDCGLDGGRQVVMASCSRVPMMG